MSFREIGQQLRAYRMESGLKAEDISAQLGISRAALYRYEKGEVIKLETITRLAELLKISPLTLLGIGVEYYAKPVGYAERLRQIEETAEQILQFFGPLCYLLTSEHYDLVLRRMLEEHILATSVDVQSARAAAEMVMNTLLARKKNYHIRKPTVIAILTTISIQKFLSEGIAPTAQTSAGLRDEARQAARHEMELLANLMESEPIGLQFGVMTKGEPNGPFALFRARDRASLAINPFPTDALPSTPSGIAMITNAEDAIAAHQHASEQVWPATLKGAAAAQHIRNLIMAVRS